MTLEILIFKLSYLTLINYYIINAIISYKFPFFLFQLNSRNLFYQNYKLKYLNMSYFTNYIQSFLAKFGLKIAKVIDEQTYHTAMSLMLCKHNYALKSHTPMERSFIKYCIENYPNSFSQRGQDLFSAWANPQLTFGQDYCIEFGAADGLYLSNTYLMSKKYGTKCLLIEPNPKFFSRLKKNRPSDFLIQGAVREIGMESGSIIEFIDEGLLTLRKGLRISDSLKDAFNKNLNSFKVKVVDLNHEIQSAFGNQVTNISYISMDTEGSELEILQTIDFDRYHFNCMTIECEEAESDRAYKIIEFLKNKGYVRVFDYGITGVDLWFLPIGHLNLRIEGMK